ncbi:MAG: hypothetical protein KC933_23485 [Myxococcales bacterium]|nr:hypothetical protein [Myxococcales bacterium]
MTTRLELLDATQRWLHRSNDTDLVADLSRFLRNVEARFAREVRHSSQETVTQLTIIGRSGALPTDCLHVRSLSLSSGDARQLDQVTAEVLREGPWWNDGGAPRMFSISGRSIYLAPVADATTGTVFDLVYYARFPALVNDADTNYLLTNHFDLYLFAMLVEAAQYVQDREMRLEFEGQFQDARRTLEEQDIAFKTSGSVRRQIGSGFVV